MLLQLREFVLGVHILLAIIWVGGVLFVGWGVFPAAKSLAYHVQRSFFLTLMRFTHWFFTGAGTGVILTGMILGTVLGPIRTWDQVWQTTYGNTWFTALVIGVVTLVWGVVIAYRQSIKIFTNTAIWQEASAGNPRKLNKALFRIALTESVEVIGFMLLIYLMISL